MSSTNNVYYFFLPEIIENIISYFNFKIPFLDSSLLDSYISNDEIISEFKKLKKNFQSVINFFRSSRYGLRYMEFSDEVTKNNIDINNCAMMYILTKPRKFVNKVVLNNVFQIVKTNNIFLSFYLLSNILSLESSKYVTYFLVYQTSTILNETKKIKYVKIVTDLICTKLSQVHLKKNFHDITMKKMLHDIINYSFILRNNYLLDSTINTIQIYSCRYKIFLDNTYLRYVILVKNNDLEMLKKIKNCLQKNKLNKNIFGSNNDKLITNSYECIAAIKEKHYDIFRFLLSECVIEKKIFEELLKIGLYAIDTYNKYILPKKDLQNNYDVLKIKEIIDTLEKKDSLIIYSFAEYAIEKRLERKIIYYLLEKIKSSDSVKLFFVFKEIVKNGDFDLLKYLVDDRDIRMYDEKEIEVIVCAIKYSKIDMTKYLFNAWKTEPTTNRNEALIACCEKNNHESYEIAKYLIEELEVDPSYPNNLPLVVACEKNNVKVANLLLEYDGVECCYKNNRPLIAAIKNGSVEIVKMLLSFREVAKSDLSNAITSIDMYCKVSIKEMVLNAHNRNKKKK